LGFNKGRIMWWQYTLAVVVAILMLIIVCYALWRAGDDL